LNRQGHGNAVDWWNLGMVTYEMLTGLPPWYTQDKELLFERIKKAPLKFPTYVSRKASSFIQKLLNRNPQERLGANGATEVKAHPFFESINWSALSQREMEPPFNPLQDQDAEDSKNFEKEFTTLPLRSMDEASRAESRSERYSSSTFENFTFSEDSFLDSKAPV
jgi:serine/threonine protein kinase